MVKKILKEFSVEYMQILDEKGHVDSKLMPKLSNTQIKDFYETMSLIRAFDKKAVSLQRQGRLGTYAQITGQEATQVGSALALDKEDWLFPSYRESGALITRDVPMETVLQYWGGDERASNMKANNFPIAIPVASQIPHAVGVAWAMKIKKHKKAALVYFGDGATSRGDFHDGMNFAGVFNVPCVFICQNNQYAISLSRKRQTAAETLAQKAIAYGIEGLQIDGNDIFAVYKATTDALKKAKSGKGSTLIECFTYRILDHTTSDDASKYRTREEVSKWLKKDPIDRLRKFMEKNKLWNEKYEAKLQKEIKDKVEKAVEKMESIPLADVEDIFKYQYETMTPILREELEDLK